MTEKITREQIEAVKATGARWVNEETFAVICDLAIRATEQPARTSGYLANEIANVKRFDRKMFDGDTDFADWAQSRARHYLRLYALAKGEANK